MRSVLGLLLAFAAPSGVAQDAPAFLQRVYTTEDGLPQNSAHEMVRTRDGYLWVATLRGLARFDGSSFDVFTSEATPGLSGDRFDTLLEDETGALWIGSQTGGLSRYADGAFRSFLEESLPWPTVSALRYGREGAVWILSPSGLARWTADGFRTYQPEGLVRDVRETPDAVWVGTTEGLFLLADGRFERVADIPVHVLLDAGGDSVWAGSEEGLLLASRSGASGVRRFGPNEGLPGRRVTSLLRIGETVWVGTDRGAARLRGGAIEAIPFADEIKQLQVLDGRLFALGARLWVLGEERFHPVPLEVGASSVLERMRAGTDGLLWIGTRGAGLVQLRERVIDAIDGTDGLASEVVHGVLEDARGDVWAGTFGAGLARIRDGQVTTFDTDNRRGGGAVMSVALDADGRLWAAGGGVGYLENGTFVTVEPNLGINILAPRSQGGVWMGSTSGRVYVLEGENVREVVSPDALRRQPVQALYEDADGTLWIGLGGGRLCHAGETTRCYGTQDGLPDNPVRAIARRSPSELWLGMYGGGLCRLTLDAGGSALGTRCVDERNGLSDGTVHNILEDRHGYTWLPSNRGLMRVRTDALERSLGAGSGDVESGEVHVDLYTAADGMPGTECNGGVQPAGWAASDGRLWIPTMGGLAVVDPARVARRDDTAAEAAITMVEVDGAVVQLVENPVLGPSRGPVVFRFRGIDFRRPDMLRFRYRLYRQDGDGQDADWFDAADGRTAVYSSLAPGSYRFEVQAASNSVGWGPSSVVTISKLPVWHQTTWFRLMAVAAAACLGAVGYRLHTRRLRRRQRELERIVEDRTQLLANERRRSEDRARQLQELHAAKDRFFANISHEFRTPLTLILTPLTDGLKGTYGALPDALRSRDERVVSAARRLLHLVNQLLELARLDEGKMEVDARPTDVTGLLRDLIASYTPLAERKAITLDLAVPEDAPSDEVVRAILDRDKVEKVISNLLANAVEHTDANGHVELALETFPGHLRMCVRDTGPGIPPEKADLIFDRFESGGTGTGIGLALSRELAQLMGGSLRLEPEEGFSSTFIFSVPWTRPAAASIEEARGGTAAPPVPSPPPATIEPPDASGRPRVLVVEDNEEMRDLLRRQLAPHYLVDEAADGRAGLDCALSSPPNLILADIMMPEMDGLEMLRRIRDEVTLADVPVMLLTARAGEKEAADGLATGAEAYVSKPFSRERLLAQIATLLEARSRLRDRYSKELVLQPGEVVVESEHEAFLERVLDVMERHIADANATVDRLADELGMSRRQFERRLKDVTGHSPGDLLRTLRMERAAALLEGDYGTISEVAAAVGYRSASHFSVAFKSAFGRPPSRFEGA